MKKYTLTNYAGSGSPTSSDLLDSSGIVDSGVVISGMVASGVVNPDDDGTWDYGTYTEEEMEEMMNSGTWKGGYVNGVYVMPSVDIHPGNGGGGENIGGGQIGGGNTGGGYTGGGSPDGGNTDEQNNTVPTPDEQSTNGDSTQNDNQGGGGTPGLPTGETNQTPTSPSNGIITYINGIPIYSFEYAEDQIKKGMWNGGFVMGADPNSPNSIAYMQSVPNNNIGPSNNVLNEHFGQYDVMDTSQWLPQGQGDCRKTCQTMQNNAGYTSSNGQFIPMTRNRDDKPYAPDPRFQEGLNYLDSELQKGRAVIVGVDYKPVNERPNLDRGSDHFILIVGKYTIAGSVFYHYFDPRTNNRDKGTRSENILYIQDGYLVGDYVDTPNKTHHYIVTRVNYNEDL